MPFYPWDSKFSPITAADLGGVQNSFGFTLTDTWANFGQLLITAGFPGGTRMATAIAVSCARSGDLLCFTYNYNLLGQTNTNSSGAVTSCFWLEWTAPYRPEFLASNGAQVQNLLVAAGSGSTVDVHIELFQGGQ